MWILFLIIKAIIALILIFGILIIFACIAILTIGSTQNDDDDRL